MYTHGMISTIHTHHHCEHKDYVHISDPFREHLATEHRIRHVWPSALGEMAMKAGAGEIQRSDG